MEEVRALGVQDATAIQEFLLEAATQKVAALKAREYLEARAARATQGELGRILQKAGTPVAIPGDELPDGWTGRIAS